MVMEITNKEDFQREVLDFDGTVLMDCWAEWCGPCRMLAPILAEVDKHFEGDDSVKVVKLNVEASADNGQIAQELGVMSIPALFYFKGGELADRSVGAAPAPFYIEKLEGIKSGEAKAAE